MRVFLSSTGRDLREHRQAAYEAIQRLDEFKCVRMEDFDSETLTRLRPHELRKTG
jgi:hypothetical protein